jgi:hypothetical protein
MVPKCFLNLYKSATVQKWGREKKKGGRKISRVKKLWKICKKNLKLLMEPIPLPQKNP